MRHRIKHCSEDEGGVAKQDFMARVADSPFHKQEG
jgi:hypothetical protein